MLTNLIGSGTIEREEFMKIMESFKHLRGGEVTVGGKNFSDITKFADELFTSMDVRGKGQLNYEEYILLFISKINQFLILFQLTI